MSILAPDPSVYLSDTVVIIIPTLNEEDNISKVIEQVRCRDFSYEIVVVDGGSTDKTCSLVRVIASVDPSVHLLHNPSRIQAAGINLAVAKFGAHGRFFIRADAHCSYPVGWSDKIVHHLIETEATSVVVPMTTVGKEPLQCAIAFAQNSKLGNGGAAHRNGQSASRYVDHGHHAGFLTDFFQKNGGYDELFAVNEDGEYDIRTATKGARVWMAADAAVTYYPRKTLTSLARQYFKYGQGRASTVLKHRIVPKLRQMVPVVISTEALLCALAFVHPVFASPFVAYLVLCLLYTVKTTKADEGVIFRVSVFLSLITMHVSWGVGFISRVLRSVVQKKI